jgi:hypothetical protein
MHAALELLTATALIGVPFAIGLPFDAVITAGVIGVALFGLAISATATEGRGTVPISAHAMYDSVIAFMLIGAGIAFGFAGQTSALAFLLAAGTLQLVLSSLTRYSLAHS